MKGDQGLSWVGVRTVALHTIGARRSECQLPISECDCDLVMMSPRAGPRRSSSLLLLIVLDNRKSDGVPYRLS